ncbi:potassium channel subfamily K member 17 isoform X1 [Meriones unguiculatus]|uniref:potassium channel subfamily K member 17 isoform X1 n=1 Tax=Meriones unguiculatus TaxID=10047 RepID=UPI000B4F63F1|nr:potassium channel subfamily K member 17 isoform X1 [Meriones unguiculatus]
MPALPSSRFSITCRPRSPSVPWWAGGCRVRGTGFLLLSYLAYLVLGTGVFWALEGRSTQDRGRNFQRDKWELLQNYTCLDGPALDLLIRGIIQAYKDGTSLLGKSTSMGRWEFVGSFFFSVSTITTIGYGNLSPQTMAARLFCIFFALVGIPFNLVVLNRLGHLMQCGVHRCAHRLGARWQDSAWAQWLTGSAALLSGLLFFLLLPPLLFSHMEGWSYVESFYFAFITLSTVGFGDYVIGMNPSRKYPLWYKNIVSLWILFGMAWLALMIKLILFQFETPGDLGTCSQCSRRNWRPGQEGKHGVPWPGCCFEGSEGATQHLEPSAQVMDFDNDT